MGRKKHPWKGMAAGAAGGLAAAYAMSLFHALLRKIAPAAAPGGTDSTARLAAKISCGVLHREPTREAEKTAGAAIHYGFGAAMGGLHGWGAGLAPRIPTGYGLPLGLALYLGAHALAAPALGLSEPPLQRPLEAEAGELASHLVYGAVADGVRRGIEKML